MSPGSVSIRTVGDGDEDSLRQVRELIRSFAAEYDACCGAVFAAQGLDAELAGLPGRYAGPSGCLLLASDGRLPAGCGAFRDLGDGTCEMKRLYVAPSHRGTGLGRRLALALIAAADHAGYRRMVLDSIPEMADAVSLYRRLGFRDATPYWDHPAGHAIFMAMDLGGEHESDRPGVEPAR
ncbi:putative N-acetyltransferase YsnE [Aquisphaera giovannonii]|uniref:Putative N-acetyltransferase YsnE n=1 Tax=Aquisphaera giovannonii TaxID=406548 RepID=A0A5B9WAG5_9BACT|nr:GNAT family N-acetyltransferase [Aquisphaera giovannonii]QEH37572.1 putative N-acetyltransferase YsnE [Aquisphaera giovannonii]